MAIKKTTTDQVKGIFSRPRHAPADYAICSRYVGEMSAQTGGIHVNGKTCARVGLCNCFSKRLTLPKISIVDVSQTGAEAASWPLPNHIGWFDSILLPTLDLIVPVTCFVCRKIHLLDLGSISMDLTATQSAVGVPAKWLVTRQKHLLPESTSLSILTACKAVVYRS